MSKLIEIAQDTYYNGEKPAFPDFKTGDTITVHLKVRDRNKERIQQFRGVVIQRRGDSLGNQTFTVHKVSNGIGVAQVFPVRLPSIAKIELIDKGIVKRSRIFYFQELKGKKSKLKKKR